MYEGGGHLPAISEADLRAIIRRATELDALDRESFTEEDVRAIAAQLGIGGAAVTRAFSLAAATTMSMDAPRWMRLGSLLVLLASPVAMAAFVGGDKKQLTFQLRNAGFWTGAAAAVTALWGEPLAAGALIAMVGGAVTSALGGVIVWARRKFGRRPPGSLEPDAWEAVSVLRESADSVDTADSERRDIGAWLRFVGADPRLNAATPSPFRSHGWLWVFGGCQLLDVGPLITVMTWPNEIWHRSWN